MVTECKPGMECYKKRKTLVYAMIIGFVILLVVVLGIISYYQFIPTQTEKECGTLENGTYKSCPSGQECVLIGQDFKCKPIGETKYWNIKNGVCIEVTMSTGEGRMFQTLAECQTCLSTNCMGTQEPSTLSELSSLVSQIKWNGASLIKTLETSNEVDYQEPGYYDMVNPAQIIIYQMSTPCLQAITSNWQIYNGFGDLGRPIYYYSYLVGDENTIVTMYSWCGLTNPNINFQSNKDALVRSYFDLVV